MSVGPALSVFVVALNMISMLGAPFIPMRIGMIGFAGTGLTAASIGAKAAGVAATPSRIAAAADSRLTARLCAVNSHIRRTMLAFFK